MAMGTGPQRLIRLLETEWQASRVGRDDVPEIIKHTTGSEEPRGNSGVLALRDRSQVYVDKGKHDEIHIYHPENAGITTTDRGFKEQNVVETVQIDISLANRTTDAGVRSVAEDRMVGDRGDLADFDEPPYPGIFGEVVYILEGVRRGLDEWDTVSYEPINVSLRNSDADVSINVELEQIARNTVV